jgi:hypothetical protein
VLDLQSIRQLIRQLGGVEVLPCKRPAPGRQRYVPSSTRSARLGAVQYVDGTYRCRPAPGRHVYVSRPAKHVSTHIRCVLGIRCVLNVEQSARLQVLELQSIRHHITHTHTCFGFLQTREGKKKRISPALLVQDTRNHQARG